MSISAWRQQELQSYSEDLQEMFRELAAIQESEGGLSRDKAEEIAFKAVRDEEYKRDANRPHYSVVSVGCGRWYWTVWPDRGAWFDGRDPAHQGYAEKQDNAEAEARAAAERIRQPHQRPIARMGASSARTWHKVKAGRKRQRHQAKSSGAAPVEFVYHKYSYDDDCHPHRIVKRTAQRISVVKSCHVEDSWEWGGVLFLPTTPLDRQILERGDTVKTRRGWEWWKLTPWKPTRPECPRYLADSIEFLGLVWPCDLTDVAKAYRQLACVHHPDRGGDGGSFKKLQYHFELAAAACKP
jgi:curved DNA-binding protein CbpA